MTNKLEFLYSAAAGAISATIMSNHLFHEVATKSFVAVVTGFLGAMAGLSAKLLFNYVRNKYTKKDDKVGLKK